MGNKCSRSKVKEPKRKDIDELAERENLKKQSEEIIEEKPEEVVEQVEEAHEEPLDQEEELEEQKIEEEEEEPEQVPKEEIDYATQENKSFEEKHLEDLERSNSDIYSESQKFDNASDKLETGTQLTLSTEATGAVQQITKLSEPTHEESIYFTYRSVTPCDMNKLDETAKVFSRRCGCDLGERHDENACKICRKIDLSDTPLLS
ncbi:glideosome-associated protein 45 [Plasmodium gaboni]|uniref:Glideosome-associated protein 45 n=1 Tax=Plasmodium gaboni TaxID=647221 RepID=A0A151LGD2_9APIC|nr:glideosome-associated protein 45 [Plasmodium gaboni]XP_028539394.1 glideosome-associated protein 45 [Plasmodium sp. gorilla clade G2]SOV23771.1 glideosome-associated protein 45 [Plasmodium sp. DRC-Itaito]KYN98030.1 glideosome-associated protein 45 [Plasmodium gaboni]SOV16358.1 glideosome-associated protein 45 [Plasmodium gaboni]SOV16875.1 glideosome-associated protein 45 [Plasmodium sp. gorilla clade G2]